MSLVKNPAKLSQRLEDIQAESRRLDAILELTKGLFEPHFFFVDLRPAVALAEVGARRARSDPELRTNFQDWSDAQLRGQAMGMAAVAVIARLEGYIRERATEHLKDWSPSERRTLQPTGRGHRHFNNWLEAVEYGFGEPLHDAVRDAMREAVAARHAYAHDGAADQALTLQHAETWARAATAVAQTIEVGIQRCNGGWTDSDGTVMTSKAKPASPSIQFGGGS